MKEFTRDQRECKLVNVFDTFCDSRYQRVCHRSVMAIANSWSFAKVGVPKLSQRSDGTYAIVDGQHRLEAFKVWLSRQRDVSEHDKLIECEVLHGLSVEEEAMLFSSQGDNRVSVTPMEELRAALVSGDKRNPYVILYNTMKKHGIPIVNSDAHTVGVRCIRALRDKCVQYGSDFIDYYGLVLRRSAWTSNYSAFSLVFVRVLAELFFKKIPAAVAVSYLQTKLPNQLIFETQQTFEAAKVSVADIVQYMLSDSAALATYNK